MNTFLKSFFFSALVLIGISAFAHLESFEPFEVGALLKNLPNGSHDAGFQTEVYQPRISLGAGGAKAADGEKCLMFRSNVLAISTRSSLQFLNYVEPEGSRVYCSADLFIENGFHGESTFHLYWGKSGMGVDLTNMQLSTTKFGTVGGSTFQYGWNRLGWDIDWDAGETRFFLNGKHAWTDFVPTGKISSGKLQVLQTKERSDSGDWRQGLAAIYVDNVRIQAVPEPSSMFAMVCAGGLLVRRRQRR